MRQSQTTRELAGTLVLRLRPILMKGRAAA